MVKYGFLHCHTQNSVKDSVMTVERLCERAKEMGAPAVALTDHGVLTGIPSFIKAAAKYEVKPIVGCEYYVKENPYDSRLHLIVYAKDYIGYQAMMKAVKLSNKRIEKVRTMLFPSLNEDIIKTCFGPGSKGYGHVIATSACIGGVLAGLNFQNEAYKKEEAKLSEMLKEFERNQDLLKSHEVKKEELEKRISMIQPLTVIKFGKEKRAADKLDEEEKRKVLAEISEKEKAVERAKAELIQLKTTKNTICKQITLCKNKFSGKGDSLREKYVALKEIREKICDKTTLVAKMESEALRYQQIFGKDDFFIELQFHGMFEEKEFMMELDRIAAKLGIPTVATNDAHMATNSEDDLRGRETVRSLRFMKMEPLDETDKELYLKDDEKLYAAIRKITTPERAQIAMENVGRIIEQCNYVPSKEKHYPVFDKSVDSFELLKKMTYEGVADRFPNGLPTKEYEERLEYELGVMKKMNVSDYQLIVQDLVNFAKKLGKMPEERYNYLSENIWKMTFEQIMEYVEADQTYVGMTVGPGRGSSAGSLVCYCLHITDIDPIEHGLLFERYLNPERVSMPDIDSDYANGYRDVVIAYTYKRYGEDAVCRIITYATSAPKSAIKDVAKAIGAAKGQEDEYIALGDALADVIPQKPHESIRNYLSVFEEMNQKNPKVDEIVKRALSIEGAYNHYGMHAAGVIISDNNDVNEYVPLSWDDVNNQWKCQLTMTEAEEDAGLLKMDYLGLKNLNIITEMLRLIYKRTGRKIDPQKDIKEEAEVIKAICGSGKTNAIFQLESAGMKDVERKLGPDKFADLVLLLAAYRPGPMDSIPSMIAVKHGKQPEYRHQMLEHILKDTYGSLIYQEQVQQIFRDLAGYSFGRADLVRRAMSKKKEAVFLAEKPIFVNGDPENGIKGCVANGILAETAEQIFDDMVDFAKYAFNKSHAAAYARVTYILCWLKYYYPIEFMTVALSWANDKQLVALIADCKEMGIQVMPVDINRSGAKFSIVDEKIYFGMTSIKGIGAVEPIIAARKEAAFTSFHDFYMRGHFKKNVTEGLINSGAFDCFCKNRKALMMAFEEMENCANGKSKNNSEIEKQTVILNTLKEIESNMDSTKDADYVFGKLRTVGYKNKTLPTVEKLQAKINSYIKKNQEINAQISEIEIPENIEEDVMQRLENEKKLIGVFLSGHPMDAYRLPANAKRISEVKNGDVVNICGIIEDFKIRQRKLDNADMAFFTLEDKSGVIEVACFTKQYASFGELLGEGRVVNIRGKVREEEISNTDNFSDDNAPDTNETKETILKISVYEVKTMTPTSKDLMLEIPDIMFWNELYETSVKPYVSPNGKYHLVLHDNLFNEIRETGIHVVPQIKNDSILGSLVSTI